MDLGAAELAIARSVRAPERAPDSMTERRDAPVKSNDDDRSDDGDERTRADAVYPLHEDPYST